MVIKIDEKNRIKVHDDHYELQKPVTRKGNIEWKGYGWYRSLEMAVHALTQTRVSEKDRLVSLNDFLMEYKETFNLLSKSASVNTV